jgi:hypothetical protein
MAGLSDKQGMTDKEYYIDEERVVRSTLIGCLFWFIIIIFIIIAWVVS